MLTMERKRKALDRESSTAERRSRLNMTPLGYWRGMLSAYQQPAFTTGPLCWTLQKSLGHLATLSSHEDGSWVFLFTTIP